MCLQEPLEGWARMPHPPSAMHAERLAYIGQGESAKPHHHEQHNPPILTELAWAAERIEGVHAHERRRRYDHDEDDAETATTCPFSYAFGCIEAVPPAGLGRDGGAPHEPVTPCDA